METINISIPADWLPEQQISLPELREVIRLGMIQLRRQQTKHHQHRDRVRHILAQAGLTQPLPDGAAASLPLSPEQRLKLAKRAAAGGPLSESIIADRADRI